MGTALRRVGGCMEVSFPIPSAAELTSLERIVPILSVRPASRRLSAKVGVFIEHLEKTFALCSQFNPQRKPY
jgi:hypothetical protein